MKRGFLLFFLTLGIFTSALAEDVKIGVIYNKVSKDLKSNMNKNLKKELDRNFENTQFRPQIERELFVDTEDIIAAVSKLEKDESIDAIVVLNENPSRLFEEKLRFNKLVIAPFFFGIHDNKYTNNLNTISTDYNLEEVIDTLKELRDSNKIDILYSQEFLELANFYKKTIDKNKLLGGDQIDLISLESLNGDVKSLSDTDSLIVISRSNDLLEATLEKTSEMGILNFSLFFSNKDEAKVLMGYSKAYDQNRRIRIASTNLLKYCEKREFSELTSKLNSASLNIIVDYEIAEILDLYIGNLSSEKISIINENKFGNIDLTIKDALSKLLQNSTNIKSKKEEVKSNSYDVKIAKSDTRPDIAATMDYEKNEATRAENNPTNAENTIKGGFTLSQVLYDEEVFSNVAINESLYDAVKEDLRQEEIDQIQDLITTYLNTLKSYSAFEIEEYNGNLMRRYLNVAKVKNSIGRSGPEDVYRFESELASSTTNLEGIRSDVFSGNSDLNRLLNTSMDNYYSINEDGIEDVIDLSIFRDFANELNKPWKMDDIKDYFIQIGIENSSKLKSLDFQIDAKERELKAAKRKRYLPKVTANINYDSDLKDPWGDASSDTKADDYWTAGVGFVLPLYTGGEIEYSKSQIQSDINKLELDRETLISEISRDISSQYRRVLANYRQISSAYKSVEASRKNLELQEDMYIKGMITITDMIDARNSLIEAEQTAASIKFDYYISIADMEGLCGKYYFEYNSEEKSKIEVLLKSLNM